MFNFSLRFSHFTVGYFREKKQMHLNGFFVPGLSLLGLFNKLYAMSDNK
jgi:hypothetical protein